MPVHLNKYTNALLHVYFRRYINVFVSQFRLLCTQTQNGNKHTQKK